jgi:hypothetical protein
MSIVRRGIAGRGGALAVAVVLGLIGSVLFQGPAAAARGPVLVRGVLERSGRPVAGTVKVYVKGYPTANRSRSALEPLAAAITQSDGLFTIRLAKDARLAQLGRPNGGYVAFTLFAFDGTAVATSAFSRRYDGTAWRSADAEGSLRIDLADGRTDPWLAGQMSTCVVWANFIKSGNYWTDIGEYHSTKNMSGTFTYGKTSDSDVSVGISYNFGSTWSTGGTVHVGNSQGVSITWAVPADSGKRVRTIFQYDWNDWYCDAFYIDTEVSAKKWNGSQAIGDDNHFLDYQCDEKHAQYENTIVEHGSFDRIDKDFVTFSWVAKVFGFDGYTSQNGASTWVQLHLHADKYAHVICGTDDFPVRSHRIYAGH